MIPWLPDFLQTISAEFSQPEPHAIQDRVSPEDIRYIREMGLAPDRFDTHGIKRSLVEGLSTGATELQKRSCALGTIILVIPASEPWVSVPWVSMWRAIRLLSPKKPVRILIFASSERRRFPERGQPIEPNHINGGLAMQCDPRSIVLYRREECLRTLVHELFHASCSDPQEASVPLVEADCEAWAEIFLCALSASGNYKQFTRLFSEQVTYALKQAEKAQRDHGVNNPTDYAWRYLLGRIDVWRHLGFHIPELTPSERNQSRSMVSLRLTKRSLA